jgi:hypothetical protein
MQGMVDLLQFTEPPSQARLAGLLREVLALARLLPYAARCEEWY